MAAPKARTVRQVERDAFGEVHAHVVVNEETGETDRVNVRHLPRVELMRVIGMEHPGARDWRRYGNDELVAAIVTGVMPDAKDDEAKETPKPITFGPTPTPTPQERTEQVRTDSITEPGTDQLANALRVAMSQVANASVNEDQVRAIVKDETADLIATAVAEVARPVVTLIQVNEQDPIQVPGRTHKDFRRVMLAIGAREHLMMVGPPGTGKTFMAEQAAESLGLAFYSIQCHAQMPASQLWGYQDANGRYVRTLFREAYECGGVFLFDEIDNGNSNILASMNAALANGVCAFPDAMVKKHPDFVVVAAANTYGTGPDAMFVGRNALDAATIDRFTRVTIDIDEDLENEVAQAISPTHCVDWLTTVRKYRDRVKEHNLRVIISPRATFAGLKLLEAGWTKQEVIEARVLAGLTDDQRAKVVG